MTPEEMKRKLRVLGAIEGAGGDISTQQVENVITADPTEDLPTAAPVRQPLVPRAVDVPHEQAPAPMVQPVEPVDPELAAARGGDVDAFNDRATETALRQIVGGITRTPVPGSISPEGTGEKDLVAHRRQRQLDQLRELEAGNNAARTAAYLKNGEAGVAQSERKLTASEEEAKRREARSAAELALKQADLERKKGDDAWKHAHPKAGKPPPARDEKGNLVPTTFKDQLRANGVALRPDEYLIDPSGPGFRSAPQAEKADLLRGNLSKLEDHRADAAARLAQFHAANGDLKKEDIALGQLGIALGAAANMVRTAEGMGDSIPAQHAADQMLSLSNGDPKNLKNALNEGRIDALLEASVGAAHHNVVDQLKHMNVGIRAGGAPAKAPPAKGKLHVSNGKETREIDPEDEEAAAADGFKRVGP